MSSKRDILGIYLQKGHALSGPMPHLSILTKCSRYGVYCNLHTVKYLLSTTAAILDIMRVKSGIGLKVRQLHGRATRHKLETCATINIVVEKEILS